MKIFWDEIPVFTKEYLKVVDITDKVQEIVDKRKVTTPLPNGRGFLGQVPGSVAPEPKYFWRH